MLAPRFPVNAECLDGCGVGGLFPRLSTAEALTKGAVSILLIKWRLAALVGHLFAGMRQFGAHLEHNALNATPHRKIPTRRAPRRQARQVRQHDAADGVDQCIDIVPAHQLALMLHDLDP